MVTFQSFSSDSTVRFPPSRALIIGAGIAGTTAALALQRAGIRSVVYDAAEKSGGHGYHITVSSNGLDGLRVIGVDNLAAHGGFYTFRTAFHDSVGRHLGTHDAGGASVTIRHACLQHLLQDGALSRGIPLEFGKRLTGGVIVPRGVEVRFEDGSRAAGEMVIGCDGVDSTVRRIIDPGAPAPRALGLLNFCGYSSSIGAGAPGQWQMILGRRAFFGYTVDPAGGTVWFADLPSSAVDDSWRPSTSDDWKRMLIRQFDGDAGPAAELIASGSLELVAGQPHDLGRVPRWSYGPIVVIGDAAHAAAPASGQGASLAIEDGVLLAKYLRQLPTPPAFAAFEQARRRRVERVVRQGGRNSRYRVPGPASRLLRDVMLPFVFRYMVSDHALAWIYDHRVEWHRRVLNT